VICARFLVARYASCGHTASSSIYHESSISTPCSNAFTQMHSNPISHSITHPHIHIPFSVILPPLPQDSSRWDRL
jgi:hypothetical protein